MKSRFAPGVAAVEERQPDGRRQRGDAPGTAQAQPGASAAPPAVGSSGCEASGAAGLARAMPVTVAGARGARGLAVERGGVVMPVGSFAGAGGAIFRRGATLGRAAGALRRGFRSLRDRGRFGSGRGRSARQGDGRVMSTSYCSLRRLGRQTVRPPARRNGTRVLRRGGRSGRSRSGRGRPAQARAGRAAGRRAAADRSGRACSRITVAVVSVTPSCSSQRRHQ